MLKIYERLTSEGKIGPFDPEGRPRPYMEYPKRITVLGADGSKLDKIVGNQREELALLSESVPGVSLESDPVLVEKNKLAAEVASQRDELAELRAQLAALSGTSAKTSSVQVPKALSPKVPANTPVEASPPT
jgi:hypothetical protein